MSMATTLAVRKDFKALVYLSLSLAKVINYEKYSCHQFM